MLSGNLSNIATSLAKKLLREHHTVAAVSTLKGALQIKHKSFTSYSISSADDQYQEIFRSHSFDLVIFIAAQEGFLNQPLNANASSFCVGFEHTLEYCRKFQVDRFLLISSIQVYGNMETAEEEQDPEPATFYGQVLLNIENFCRFYYANYQLAASIIRVPFVYGPEENASLLNRLLKDAVNNRKIVMNADAFSPCDFLHIEDLLDFISSVINDAHWLNLRVFNLPSEVINFSSLTQLISYHFPKVNITFTPAGMQSAAPRTIVAEAARNLYAWNARRRLVSEIPVLVKAANQDEVVKGSFFQKLKNLTVSLRPLLVWGEVIAGAFLMHMLTVWTDTIIEFKYIDYRLLFVVIIGSTHGLLYGVFASVLAAISAAISWFSIGIDWALLVYNVENWIPFALFFLAGAVTGYAHDKQENEIGFERHQTELIHEKYEFLYSLYDEISTLKNRLREQLVGYRDSFGRFYKIASELNDLDEDNIFLKALDILEDLMKNDQIAIYTIESTGRYGRLEVKSTGSDRAVPKSLNLSEFSQAQEILTEGNIFQNKELLPNYPAYIAPIMDKASLIGLVVLWEAEFEQFTMYYYNLFRVVTGLIQSSLVRAAMFRNTQTEELYLPHTGILRPQPFRQSIEMKKKMKRNKVLDFQIVAIPKGGMSWQELFEKLSKGIREDDTVGVLNENDSKCYAFLSHAGYENIGAIQTRLLDLGLESEHILEIESN